MTLEPRKPRRSSKGSEKRSDIRPIKDVFKQKADSIVIPTSKKVNVRPEEKEFARFFHLVECRSFKDLQSLSLIPGGLEEKLVRKAIAEDDEEALSMAREYLRSHRPPPCGEKGNPTYKTRLSINYTAKLYSTYNAIRKTYNFSLSKLLLDAGLESSRSNIGVRSMFVGCWMKNLQKAEATHEALPLNVCSVGDLTIQRNATFILWPFTDTLLANHIRIHVGGKLEVGSSYIKIRCASIEGNID